MSVIHVILIGVLGNFILIGTWVLWGRWRSGQFWREIMPRPFRDRESMEHLWRQRFQNQAIETADAVLQVVCDAFIFNSDHRYKLAPDDAIMQIYRALYPHADSWFWWWSIGCDAQEIESVLKGLNRRFGFHEAEWRDNITIGEIVEICHRETEKMSHS